MLLAPPRRFYDHVGPAFPMVVRHAVKEEEGRSLGNIMVSSARPRRPVHPPAALACSQALPERQPAAELPHLSRRSRACRRRHCTGPRATLCHCARPPAHLPPAPPPAPPAQVVTLYLPMVNGQLLRDQLSSFFGERGQTGGING